MVWFWLSNIKCTKTKPLQHSVLNYNAFLFHNNTILVNVQLITRPNLITQIVIRAKRNYRSGTFQRKTNNFPSLCLWLFPLPHISTYNSLRPRLLLGNGRHPTETTWLSGIYIYFVFTLCLNKILTYFIFTKEKY